MTARPSRERSDDQERALAMVMPVVERLRSVLDVENRELQQRQAVDYHSHSQRKNQGLLELTRLRASLASLSAHPRAQAAFADLTSKLELNHQLLGAQLRAARTISGIVARAIRDGQSDGTYSAYPWRDDAR